MGYLGRQENRRKLNEVVQFGGQSRDKEDREYGMELVRKGVRASSQAKTEIYSFSVQCT